MTPWYTGLEGPQTGLWGHLLSRFAERRTLPGRHCCHGQLLGKQGMQKEQELRAYAGEGGREDTLL